MGDKQVSRCKGVIGWLFGHHYVARYDTSNEKGSPTVAPTGDGLTPKDAIAIMDSSCERKSTITYIHDVCTRCGHVVERKSKQ